MKILFTLVLFFGFGVSKDTEEQLQKSITDLELYMNKKIILFKINNIHIIIYLLKRINYYEIPRFSY